MRISLALVFLGLIAVTSAADRKESAAKPGRGGAAAKDNNAHKRYLQKAQEEINRRVEQERRERKAE